jgi:excinuclease UvrABC nuclease subunit
MVETVRLFLSNRRSELLERLYQKIEESAAVLDFETAAFLARCDCIDRKVLGKSAIQCVAR